MLEYYAIYSPRIKAIVGATTDWKSLTDCDDCQFIEISEQEFSDEDTWKKSIVLQRQKFQVKLEKRLIKVA